MRLSLIYHLCNVTINQIQKKMKVSVFIMKKTTNNNATTNNELMVTGATTPVVATGKKLPVKSNAKVTNKKVSDILSFDATMQLMRECGIGSKSNTKNYRIMNGGSSIHVLKTKYRIYATAVDFENCKNIKSSDLQLLENDNMIDEKRPHTITCDTIATLKKIFNAFAKNTANAPC